jgi:hypothetical protein
MRLLASRAGAISQSLPACGNGNCWTPAFTLHVGARWHLPSMSHLSSEGQIRLKLIDMNRSVQNTVQSDLGDPVDARFGRRWAVGITSLAFIALQSACSFVIAVSGVRVLIGLGALAAATLGAHAPPSGLHRDAIRIPMMILAVAGSLINLYVIWRVRSLRKRPSAQWRQQPISRRRIWGENTQLALAVLTLVLVVAELFSHLYIFRFVR